jgi:hypothetical protein
VTRLWDKHLPKWRQQRAEREELSPEAQKALVDLINRIPKEGHPISSSMNTNIQDMQYVHIERQIFRKKGKWVRVPPEV